MATKTLIVALIHDGRLPRQVLELVRAARSVALEDEAVEALVLGADTAAAAEELSHYVHGVTSVASAELAAPNSETLVNLVAKFAREMDAGVVLLGATRTGLSVAPRLAVELGAALLEDVIAVERSEGKVQARRYAYLARVTETVRARASQVVITVKPNALGPAEPNGKVSEVRASAFDDALVSERVSVCERVINNGAQVALEEADIVVAGGRGLGSAQRFAAIVEPLATELRAGVASTRAVVDAGWRPYAEQVGQTGKNISPKLYLALGISGAVQHLSGMNRSKVIAAINRDPDAPIFRICDYAVVGDIEELGPALLAALQKR